MVTLKRFSLIMLYFLVSNTSLANEDIRLVENWLSLEKQKSVLNSAWSERKEKIQQQIALLKKEQQALEQLIAKSDSNKTEVSEQRKLLVSQQREFEAFDSKLTTELDKLVSYLNGINAKLPQPLQQQWQEVLPTLSQKANSQKLENVLKLLKQAWDFDQRIVFHTGLVKLSTEDAKSILVEQVYLGISHGWYVSADNLHFGYGRSDANNWQWWHGSQVEQVLNFPLTSDQVSAVTHILKHPTSAKYVQLPLAVNKTGERL